MSACTTGPPGGAPVVLVHGFGASLDQFRRTIPALAAAGHRVYALDLLGQGRSAKPVPFEYTMEVWRDQVADFVLAFSGPETPAVLIGNSLGALASLMVAAQASAGALPPPAPGGALPPLREESGILAAAAAAVARLYGAPPPPPPAPPASSSPGLESPVLTPAESPPPGDGAPRPAVRGLVLLNCAGGLNNKAVVDDWRVRLALPVFALVDALLKNEWAARALFDRVRTPSNVRSLLEAVYTGDPSAVDDALVDSVVGPAADPGALEAFVSILTGPPGPRPETLMPRVAAPVLVLWGLRDLLTPIDGTMGKYFRGLQASGAPRYELVEIPGAGHCPHDDSPAQVHAALLPWLAALK